MKMDYLDRFRPELHIIEMTYDEAIRLIRTLSNQIIEGNPNYNEEFCLEKDNKRIIFYALPEEDYNNG